MSRSATTAPRRAPRATPIGAPLIWTFDGPFTICLTDIEDVLRRAIVQLDDVSGVAVALDVSLDALAARVAAGDRVQPAWSRFLDRVSQRYGLPLPLRVRHGRGPGPLATLVIVYRS